jgi:hypothetical protein
MSENKVGSLVIETLTAGRKGKKHPPCAECFFFLWRRVNGNRTGNNLFLSTELHLFSGIQLDFYYS